MNRKANSSKSSRCGIRVKTHIKAGGVKLNHNETQLSIVRR